MAGTGPARPRVILVGCAQLRPHLKELGIGVTTTTTIDRLLRPNHGLDGRVIVALQSSFEGLPTRDTIDDIRRAFPLVDVVTWAPGAAPEAVRDMLLAGARDVVLTESPERCARAVAKLIEAQQLMPRVAEKGYEEQRDSVFHGMLARSRRMWDVFDVAARIATTDAPVLIRGETGTGKELLARAVHRLSGRRGPFVPVNCAAIAESLVDSELFGHVKGAFTGAVADKAGLFRHSDEGTLMLDEIGRISLSAQHRLLRALQEGSVRPVGAHAEIAVDVRIVAATSTALETDVQKGRFREDLFYRLDVIRLEIPPLRERPEDIVFLFGHFARELARQYDLTRPDVTDGFLDALIEYDWPGNVRQLENFTERLLLTHAGGLVAEADIREQLPFERKPRPAGPAAFRMVRGGDGAPLSIDSSRPLHDALRPHVDQLERAYLEACLTTSGGRMAEAAERAGISRRTLLRKLRQHGLDKADFKDAARPSSSPGASAG